MNIIGREKLLDFSKKHPETSDAILRWIRIVGVEATWKKFSDVKESFGSVDLVKPNNCVFNIRGNKLRLIASIDFISGAVIVKWIGFHSDYDKLNVSEI